MKVLRFVVYFSGHWSENNLTSYAFRDESYEDEDRFAHKKRDRFSASAGLAVPYTVIMNLSTLPEKLRH